MAIQFDASRWDHVKKTYNAWWNHELDRPLYKYVIKDAHDRTKEKPSCPVLSQKNVNDFSMSADDIIDALDYELSGYEFLGDSFPYINFDVFGPGLITAFCGANLDNSSGNVWFFPSETKEIDEIHIKYNPDNKWVKRVKDIYTAGMKRWKGNVLMSTPDLGGNFDSVAVFRGTENLLYDLYDEPEEVKRVLAEADTAWFEAFADINSILHPQNVPNNPGYSDWAGLYSETPSYILQSDFSFNISTPMFEEFTLPQLKFFMNRLDHTMYHLDGYNQVKHLPLLLNEEKLNAIQWIYGDGQPGAPHWIDLYKTIEASGKGNQIAGSPLDFYEVEKQVHKNLYYTNYWSDGSYSYFQENASAIKKYLCR